MRASSSDTDVANICYPQRKRTAAGVKSGLTVDDDTVAVFDRGGQVLQQLCWCRQPHRHLLIDIAQREIRQLPRRLHIDLGQLAFDPEIAEAFNPALDLGINRAD